MSEKHLTEPPWKMLVIKHKLKDPGLQKAMVAYGKLDAQKDQAKTLDCLSEIAEHAGKLKKANQDNKDVASYLTEIINEATTKTKQVSSLPKPKDAAAEAEPDGKDIKAILLNGLKKVKGADNSQPFAFVACVAKPSYGLLLAKSPSEKIGMTHKKLLTDQTSGTKFIVGTCIFENDAHTFVVEKVPGGLARNLKKAIKEFTGLSCRVRVRDIEGKVVTDGDADTTPEETDSTQPTVQPAVSAAPTPALAAQAPSQAAQPTGQAENAEAMTRFTARLKILQPNILKAIASKTPMGEQVRQRADEVSALAGKKDFEQANRVLDALEALLKQSESPVTPANISPSTQPAAAAPAGPSVLKPAVVPNKEPETGQRQLRLSTYLSGRANLRAARENATKELQRLQQTIVSKCAGEPFFKDVEAKSQKLFEFLAPIDDSVINKLDEAGKCPDPELQVVLNKKVRELIQRQLSALRGHALASFVQKNPFGKFVVMQPLEVTLSALDKQLS